MDMNHPEDDVFVRRELLKRPLNYILAFAAPTNSYRNGLHRLKRRWHNIRAGLRRKMVKYLLGFHKRPFEKKLHLSCLPFLRPNEILNSVQSHLGRSNQNSWVKTKMRKPKNSKQNDITFDEIMTVKLLTRWWWFQTDRAWIKKMHCYHKATFQKSTLMDN